MLDQLELIKDLTFIISVPSEQLWRQVLAGAANGFACHHFLTEPKVHDLDVARQVHEDVLELEVPVDDAEVVKILEADQDL